VIDSETEVARSPLYSAYRNTLMTLIVLFTIYLVFEFITLWRREFPPGFYYAGYAHQGAAWLTFALALATATSTTASPPTRASAPSPSTSWTS